MKYIIDTANLDEINQSLKLGIRGITANPSMYIKNNVDFFEFINTCNSLAPEILTAEVMGNDIDEMLSFCNRILDINKDIIIKVNFSPLGLELINILSNKGVKTACTLIFNVNQASIAINAGADYIFPFIGRNDENGQNGIEIIENICKFIKNMGYSTKTVAASIKNVYHLERACLCGCDYAAVTYNLLEKAMDHPLTTSGYKIFENDWNKL